MQVHNFSNYLHMFCEYPHTHILSDCIHMCSDNFYVYMYRLSVGVYAQTICMRMCVDYMYSQGRIQDLWLGGGVSRRGVWGPLIVPQRVVGRALVGGPGGQSPPPPPKLWGFGVLQHLTEQQF